MPRHATPPPRALLVALACGCSATLDWDRTDTQPLDAPTTDAVVTTDRVPSVDSPRDQGSDAPADLPASDRTCTPACRGSDICCNGACRECCANSDCRTGRVCCRGSCEDRC